MRVLLFGPTACGKTALAVAIARRLGGSVVNSDSRLLYRGMDLGTAKPTAAERGGVEHLLLDISDPGRPVSAGEWRAAALAELKGLAAAGIPAVIAGGTGLYAKILLAGWDLGGVATDTAQREEWEAMEAASPGALHALLVAEDPGRAAELSPRDVPRVARALELARAGALPAAGEPLGALAVGLIAPREWLGPRIARRAESMVAGGLAEEAMGLWRRWPESRVLAKTIGYAEFAPGRSANPLPLIERATLALAKRQRTWMGSLPLDHRLDAARGAEELSEEIAGWL